MSVFVYTERHPLRTSLEFWVRLVYFLVGFVMLTAFLVTFVLWVGRVDDTFDNYWEGSDIKLEGDIFSALKGCAYKERVKVGQKDVWTGVTGVEVEAGVLDSMYHLMTAADAQNAAFAVLWHTVVLSLVNKVLFAANWWHLRVRGLVIRTNIILPTLEVVLHVWSIVAIARTYGPIDFAESLVHHCTLRAESPILDPIDHSFDLSFDAILVVLCVNLFFVLLGLVFVIVDGFRKENARWAEVWYTGYHRKAVKGVPGPVGMGANEEITPPKAALLQAMKHYPEVFEAAEQAQHEPKVVERRQDMADGSFYTRDEFQTYYGKKNGQVKWEAAQDTSMVGVEEPETVAESRAVVPSGRGGDGPHSFSPHHPPAENPILGEEPRASPYHFAKQEARDAPPYYTPSASRMSNPPQASDV